MKTYKDFMDENFEPHDEGFGSIAKGFKRKIHKTIDKATGGIKKGLQKTAKGFKSAFKGSKAVMRQGGAEKAKNTQAAKKRMHGKWATKMRSAIHKISLKKGMKKARQRFGR